MRCRLGGTVKHRRLGRLKSYLPYDCSAAVFETQTGEADVSREAAGRRPFWGFYFILLASNFVYVRKATVPVRWWI